MIELSKSDGRIKINTKRGNCKQVNDFYRNTFILQDIDMCKADSQRQYYLEDQYINVNPCKNASDILKKIKF